MGDEVEVEMDDVELGGKQPATLKALAAAPPRIHMRWENIVFEVEDSLAPREKGERVPIKRVLHGVSGQVAPGTVCCVIGPSGAGKSSLLNLLSGQHTASSGRVLVNGEEVATRHVKRFSGYVQQQDDLIPALTVRETLAFACRLKLPTGTPQAERDARIDGVLRDLDLQHIQNSRIGTMGKGISGGERRRLVIAVEILNSPPLLVLDEPTSGLDSASALMIVRVLRKLAADLHTAVLCTLHQPRASVLRGFDGVILLGKGRVVYNGPPGEDLVRFFGDNGHDLPQRENPADWLLDLINTKEDDSGDGGGENAAEEDRASLILRLSEAYAASAVGAKVNAPPDKYPPPLVTSASLDTAADGSGKTSSRYITPWFNQTLVVLHRSFLHKLREPAAALTQAFNAVLMPMLIGSVFWQISDDFEGADRRLSLLSLVIILQAFFPFDVLLLFPSERSLYLREHRAGLYSTSAFYVGRSAADVPLHTLFSFVTAAIVYGMAGLRPGADHFFSFALTIVLLTQAGASLFMAISAFAPDFETSNIMASMVLIVLFLYDGNVTPTDSIPVSLRWLRHLSLNNAGLSAAIYNELHDLPLSCGGAEGCVEPLTGDDFLATRGLEDVSVPEQWGRLLIMIVAYRALAYVGLRFTNRGSRR